MNTEKYESKSRSAAPKKTGAQGTAELRTERLILRRYCPEDAEPL